MPRISKGKLIQNEELYTKLAPRYIKLIDNLKEQYRVVENLNFANMVNFDHNKELPKHSWFLYKQGYSENLVKVLLREEQPSKEHYVLDPFSGVGTSNLVAQSLGYKSIAFEVNPIAGFATKVKTNYFNDSEIDKIARQIKSFSPVMSTVVPDSTLLVTSFPRRIFNSLMKIKGFYEQIENRKVRDFFKLAYLSIIENCSNRIKDGNGIKIAKNKLVIEDAVGLFLEKATMMLKDLSVSNYSQEVIIYNGSITKNLNKIKDKKVGIVVFSPPYANCFDYLEVYKLELWMGDFVKSYDDFKKYREGAVRSHVNASFNHTIKYRNINVDLIAETISCFNIWNKNIPDMIRGYFDDMTQVFEVLHSIMVNGAKCFIIVANSSYKGILVPTDLIFADIGKQLGFKPLEIIHARKMRASSQQEKELNGKYGDLKRESIVVLEKR